MEQRTYNDNDIIIMMENVLIACSTILLKQLLKLSITKIPNSQKNQCFFLRFFFFRKSRWSTIIRSSDSDIK